MSKQTATLIDGSTYVLGNKFFFANQPQEVTPAEKAVLEKEVRSFSDPTDPKRTHEVKRFTFAEVADEAPAPAGEPAAPAGGDGAGAGARTR